MTDTAETEEAPDTPFTDLEWLPIADYHPEISAVAVLIDEAGKVVLGVQDACAPVGTFLDDEMRPLDFKPTFWAVPTEAAIEALSGR
jgi:hypothetical protein